MKPILSHWLLRCSVVVMVAACLPRITQAQPTLNSVVAIYVLAYDNQPTSPMNLTPYYSTTLATITMATANDPNKTAIVLADLDGMGDTHIRVIQHGIVATVYGLPNANAILSPTLHEYDVTDGATLGGFIRWTRNSYEADVYTFTYIGHGMPLVPETDMNAIFDPAPLAYRPAASLPPLPTNIGANPAVTDEHTPLTTPNPYAMLTPYRLAQALNAGLADSNTRFAYVDVVQCFAASIEEWYEIAPYTEMIIGSPNYAFFDPTSPGKIFNALNPDLGAKAMADLAVSMYDAILPVTNHPRIIASINANQANSVKQAWDTTATLMYADLLAPTKRAATRQALLLAYLNSRKYDSTYCTPQDFELQAPDGLVDFRHFAENIRKQFSTLNPDVATWASITRDRIANDGTLPNQLISARAARNGFPWFDPTPTLWEFNGVLPSSLDDDAAGVSIYADLQGQMQGSTTALSWHAHWYHDDASISDNQHPYEFLRDGQSGIGWDEVFQEYWQGISTSTYACVPDLPPARTDLKAENDLRVLRMLPDRSEFAPTKPITLAAVIGATQTFEPVLVQFEVRQQTSVVFSQTVQTTALLTGSTLIKTTTSWVPTVGTFQVRIMVDADNRIEETNENNNLLERTISVSSNVAAPPVISAILKNQQQLLADRSQTLEVQQRLPVVPAVSRLVIQTYQFQPTANPRLYAPILIATDTLETPTLGAVPLVLPPTLQPGAVVLHLWAESSAGRSLAPVVLRFNYAPPNATLKADEQHVFRLRLQRDDAFAVFLDVEKQQNADLLLWEPFVQTNPTQQSTVFGGDALRIDPVAISGEFVLAVRATTLATYTLTGVRNNQPLRPLQTNLLGMQRPQFLEPAINPPVTNVFLPIIVR